MTRAPLSLAAGLLLIHSAAAAQPPCLTGSEAESLTLVAMPEIIRQTGQVCATRLPSTSILRSTSGTFLSKYQTAADHAWPAARAAIVKLSDPAIDALLQSDYARPLLVSLVAPQIVGRIAPSDCATVDRLASRLEPLPPRNTAGLVVTALQYLKAQQAKGARITAPELPLCTGDAR